MAPLPIKPHPSTPGSQQPISQQQQQQQQQQSALNTSNSSTLLAPGCPSTTATPPANAKLLPIAPLIAPKPSGNGSRFSTSGIMTSKQWVLPPRPKAGRKPSSVNSNHTTQATNPTTGSTFQTHQNTKNKTMSITDPVGSIESGPILCQGGVTSGAGGGANGGAASNGEIQSVNIVRKNSMNSLSNNISNLQISNYESKKNELELATEENLKLKDIIHRVKMEIESLQRNLNAGTSERGINASSLNTLTNEQLRESINAVAKDYQVDLSPTINPTVISNMNNAKENVGPDGKKIKVKRTYKKKAKKIVDDSPSPISLNELNNNCNGSSDIPNIDQILNNNHNESDESSTTNKKKKIKVPKVPKAAKIPKKKKEPKIKKEEESIVPSSLLTTPSYDPVFDQPAHNQPQHPGIKSEFDPVLTTSVSPPSSLSYHHHHHHHSPFSQASQNTTSFNSPSVHPYSSIQLSRTTTIGTMNTMDTIDTLDTLATFDEFPEDFGYQSSFFDEVTNSSDHNTRHSGLFENGSGDHRMDLDGNNAHLNNEGAVLRNGSLEGNSTDNNNNNNNDNNDSTNQAACEFLNLEGNDDLDINVFIKNE